MQRTLSETQSAAKRSVGVRRQSDTGIADTELKLERYDAKNLDRPVLRVQEDYHKEVFFLIDVPSLFLFDILESEAGNTMAITYRPI